MHNLFKRQFEIRKEYFLRFFKDKMRFRNNGRIRLYTHYDMVFANLKLLNVEYSEYNLLEIFGRHGLWTTADYAPYCRKIDLWEARPIYAKYAKRFLTRIKNFLSLNVIQGDSIKAIQNGQISSRYNLIVCDNPIVSPYSAYLQNSDAKALYFENFDLFPKIYDVLDKEAIFICNVLLNPDHWFEHVMRKNQDQSIVDEEWLKRRQLFFHNSCNESGAVALNDAIESYKKTVPSQGFSIKNSFYVPMDFSGSMILLVLHLSRDKS